MSENLTINSVAYPYPAAGDTRAGSINWGTAMLNWARAATAGMLQKSGGTFTLTADVDFGAAYGLKAAYLKDRGANAAASGTIRLSNLTSAIAWRNAANSADLALKANASDILEFNGVPVGVATLGDVVGPGSATDNAVPRFDSTTGKLVQDSKLTVDDNGEATSDSLAASRALVSGSGKQIQSSAVTATELGYLSGLASALQAQLDAIKLPRPAYQSTTDTSQVVVPASAATPARVKIGSTIYENTSDATMDLDTSGRGGLDTGAKAANTPYYLYAIPAVSGTAFDLVCSVTPPTTGPTGFASWSYLGAFATDSGSAIIDAFKSVRGLTVFDDEIDNTPAHSTTTKTAYVLASLPVTATHAYGWLQVKGSAVDVRGRLSGSDVVGTNALTQGVQVADDATDALTFGFVPLLTPQTVYLSVDAITADAYFYLTGWREDPMAYN